MQAALPMRHDLGRIEILELVRQAVLGEIRAAMMQCKTPTAYDKVYKVRSHTAPARGVRSKMEPRISLASLGHR